MNVTIKIDEDLCKEARHQAVDKGLSLSGWIAKVLQKELASGGDDQVGLMAALAMEEGEEKDFEIPREASGARDLNFGE